MVNAIANANVVAAPPTRSIHRGDPAVRMRELAWTLGVDGLAE